MHATPATPCRRDVLSSVALSIAGVALAGCGGTPETDTETATETGTETTTETEPEIPPDQFDGIAPQPRRNKNVEGRSVYAATGEFSPVTHDLETPGRGEVSFTLARKYRSALAGEVGAFGRGWTWTHDKRVGRDGEAIVFDTGRGEQYRFAPAGEGTWHHPHFYAVLVETETGTEGGLELRYGDGTRFVFESPDEEGRLRSYADPSGNAYAFSYEADSIRITTPRGTTVVLSLDEDGKIVGVTGPGDEQWTYDYGGGDGQFLRAVERPDGSVVRYDYDDAGLLVGVTKPGDDEPYLVNEYEQIDGGARVVSQRHGANGGTYDFFYERIDSYAAGGATYPIYRTHVARKNRGSERAAANVHMTHDATGLDVERAFDTDTEEIADDALTDEEMEAGTARLVTETTYDDHLAVVERTSPAGDVERRAYDDSTEDPRARGNLTSISREPAPDAPSDHDALTLSLEWADVGEALPIYRRVAETDPNDDRREFSFDDAGRLVAWRVPDVEHYDVAAGPGETYTRDVAGTYAYNEHGQLVRRKEWGAVTEYAYYGQEGYDGPAADGLERGAIEEAISGTGGGLLARVSLDAGDADLPQELLAGDGGGIRTGFVYDRQGNVTGRLDGEGNATRLERDALGRTTAVVDRAGVRQTIERDAMGNVTAIDHAFERNHVGPDSVATAESVEAAASELRLFWEHDQLDNVTAFGRRAGGREHRIELERDENENVVERRRGDQAVSYRYGDRNLLIEETWAPGTEDERSHTYRYARDGQPLADTDAKGRTIRRTYDGHRRLRTTRFPNGLVGRQHRDPAGYLERVQLFEGAADAEGDAGVGAATGPDGAVGAAGSALSPDGGGCHLAEVGVEHDAAGRVTRTTRRRIGPPEEGCEPLGESAWDGAAGVAQRVVEHGEAGPTRVWEEPGRVTEHRYDAAGRLVATHSPTGFTNDLNYDGRNAISRVLRVDDSGAAFGGDLADADASPHYQEYRVERDAKGRPTAYLLNGEPKRLFGYNQSDQVTRVEDAEQTIWRLHDEFGRAVGAATRAGPSRASGDVGSTADAETADGELLVRRRELDDLGRTTAMVDPGGGRTRVEYDALDNPTRVRYPDGTTEAAEYDAAGNLVRWVTADDTEFAFEYDAADEIVAEVVDGGERRLTYERDALGRPRSIDDDGSGVAIQRRYDSLGNVIEETVDGRTLTREYDAAGNVTRIGYPGGTDVRNTFDDVGRLAAVERVGGGRVWEGSYDAEFLADEVYGGGVMTGHTSFENNCTAGCVSRRWFEDADGELIDGVDYQYNPDGTIGARTWLGGDRQRTDEFTHDTAKRLTAVDHGLGHGVEYGYGALDTIEAATVTGADGERVADLSPTTDGNHRPASFGDATFEHDAALNRVSESGYEAAAPSTIETDCEEWTYDYDPWNRLSTVRCLGPDGETIREIEWTYDPLNRPVGKTVTDTTGETTETYVWADHQLIERRTARSAASGTLAGEAVGAGGSLGSDGAVGAGAAPGAGGLADAPDDGGALPNEITTATTCDTETTLVYGRTLAEILTEEDDGSGDGSDGSGGSGDDSDDGTATPTEGSGGGSGDRICPTGRWYVVDDGKTNNVAAVDPDGSVDEEFRYDGLGDPIQTLAPGDVDRVDQHGRIDNSRFPTLGAAGVGVLDVDGSPTARENLFGDVLDPRNRGMFAGRRGRDGAGITTGVEDLPDSFGGLVGRRAWGNRTWSTGARASTNNGSGGGQIFGMSPKQAGKKGAAMGAKFVGNKLNNDGSSGMGKQSPSATHGVTVSGKFGGGKGVGDVKVSVKVAGKSSPSVSVKSIWNSIKSFFESIFGGGSGSNGSNTTGTSGASGNPSGGDSSSGNPSQPGDGENGSTGESSGDGSGKKGSSEDEDKKGSKKNDGNGDKKGNENDDSNNDDSNKNNNDSNNDSNDDGNEENDDKNDKSQEGGSDTGTSDSKGGDAKGSKNSTPAPGGGPGGCGPAAMCRGPGVGTVDIAGQQDRADELGRDGDGCGPAMLCRNDGAGGGGGFGIGLGGGGSMGPDCRRMICRNNDTIGGVFFGGGGSISPGVCKYAICHQGTIGAGLDGVLGILGTDLTATLHAVPTAAMATTAPAGYGTY